MRRHTCDISDIDPVDERCNSWGRLKPQAGLDSRSIARVARRKQPGGAVTGALAALTGLRRRLRIL
jgi:hypothetical protein